MTIQIPLFLLSLSLLQSTSSQSLVTQQQAPLFPISNIPDYPGPTSPGAQPDLINSRRQPLLANHFPILEAIPDDSHQGNNNEYKPSRNWGNLSPMFSIPPSTFGIPAGPEIPIGCSLDQVHLLHRHGARYPTTDARPSKFAQLIQSAQRNHALQATGKLSFLNSWTYKLGSEILTPFGRSQMFQLGVSYRQKYGFLLPPDPDPTSSTASQSSSESGRLVFRTTSQDRMYHSALNFAAGFFGLPVEQRYHQLAIIEHAGFNNSLAPNYACPNYFRPEISKAGDRASEAWNEISLKSTRERLNALVSGIEFSIKDIYTMQDLCAYETVALGRSEFCNLFTVDEWQNYAYSGDLDFWYGSSFGSPTAAALGAGYTEELLARLTKTLPRSGMTSINYTLDANPLTFPLDQPIYVDATHDTVISAVIVALNLTSFASSGPPPTDHRPQNRSFRVEVIAPFGAQLTTQVLTCQTKEETVPTRKFVRLILNDGVVPLEGIKGCQTYNRFGLCGLDDFVSGLKTRLVEIDYQKTCFGNSTQ